MKTSAILTVLVCLLTAFEALACRPPDYADIDISRNIDKNNPENSTAELVLHFQWDEGKGPLKCKEGTAIEFEVLIDTAPVQKCFAQPPGGKDENKNVLKFQKFDGYTDVWNYYFDYTVDEAHAILEEQCEGIDKKWAYMVVAYDETVGLDDEVANFGFGTLNPAQFILGELYEVRYPLEIPGREECDDVEAGWGYAQISMAVIQNTCLLDEAVYDCPHLIGFTDCENFNKELQERYVLQHRLCAPTGGVWKIEEPNADYNSRGGGMCVDEDHDGYFANVPQVEMFGNTINDCNDNPVALGAMTLEGGENNTEIERIYPAQSTPIFRDTLVTAVKVTDPDGIKQFTVTIDEIERPECKARKFVSLRQDPQDFVLTLDLKACLGTDYGPHKYKVWVVDRCDNGRDQGSAEYNFIYQSGGNTCSSPPTGEILSADKDGEVEFTVSDYDGLVLYTLAVNGINEDRCKFRSAVNSGSSQKIVTRSVSTELELQKCLIGTDETLTSLQLWAVDECGNTGLVHNYKLP